jgi:hypothetical protein
MRLLLRSLAGLVALIGSFWVTLFLLDKDPISDPRASRLSSENSYDYRNGASEKLWLGSGWAWPEPIGVWTDGNRSEIKIRVDAKTRRLEILMNTSAYIVPKKRPWQQVSVIVRGKQISTWGYDEKESSATRRIDLARRDMIDGEAQIELVARDPQSPKSLGMSDLDSRKIAILLTTMLVREFY